MSDQQLLVESAELGLAAICPSPALHSKQFNGSENPAGDR
jgi:hypothetical protein